MTKHIIVIFTLFISLNGYSQDPNFSQFYNVPVYYNPAMNAINNGVTINSHNRLMWTSIPKKLDTYLTSVEIESIGPFNFGALLISNIEGQADLRTNGGYFNFSFTPTFLKKNHKMQLGTSIGILSKTINENKFIFSDQLDEVYGNKYSSSFNNEITSFNSLDLKFGLAYRWIPKLKKKSSRKSILTGGISINHFPGGRDAFTNAFENTPIKKVVHADYQLKINKIFITPSFIYESQNNFKTFTFGFNTKFLPPSFNNLKWSIGLFYRNRRIIPKLNDFDAVIFTTGYDFRYSQNKKHIRINYSYDWTLSKLSNNMSLGSHELGIQFSFDDLIFLKTSANKKLKQRMHECSSEL